MSTDSGRDESGTESVTGVNASKFDNGAAPTFETLADKINRGGETDEKSENVVENVGDLVWGKVRSYPWWPGQVFDSSSASKTAMEHFKKGSTLIAYFGDCSFAWNDVSNIKPFHQHFSEMHKQSNTDEFLNAVDCALEEVSRRVEFGLSCGCLSEEAYNKLKTQKINNTGIREDTPVRYGGDKLSDAINFQPAELVEYMKDLACFPKHCETDELQLVTNGAHLSAFHQWRSVLDFPKHKTSLRSVENKRKVDESWESCESVKKIKNNDNKEHSALNNCDAERCGVRALPLSLRVESEMDSLTPCSNSSLHNAKTGKEIPEESFSIGSLNFDDIDKFLKELNSKKPTSITETSEDSASAPYALILKFADSGSVPSEEKLNSIFKRYGPLKESMTKVMKKGKKAKVVFRSGEDAKTAFSSSGKYSIFGPSLLSYKLEYVCPKTAT